VPSSATSIVRFATLFYAGATALACLYAWIFGHADRLLGDAPPTGRSLLEGLFLGLIIVGVSHAAHAAFRSVRQASALMGQFLGPLTAMQAVWLAVLSGFAEEIFFRGALWPHTGLVGGAILFGLLHTVPARALMGYPVFAFLAGLVLGLLREQSGSIWPAVLCHFVVNALNLAWLGRMETRRRSRLRAARVAQEPPPALPIETAELLPVDQSVDEEFPRTVWRYHLRLDLTGTDRHSLPDCLEEEQLAMFAVVPREEVYRQLREGRFVFGATFAEPFAPFPEDLAALSAYLFQIVTGVEVAERFVDEKHTDDVRAWKISARQGEWVKVPILVEETEPGRFDVDPDREDTEVVAAHWNDYPRWFQDGMRFKYPRLREL
jgi:membrane protease YdiL (CAAX protease family)